MRCVTIPFHAARAYLSAYVRRRLGHKSHRRNIHTGCLRFATVVLILPVAFMARGVQPSVFLVSREPEVCAPTAKLAANLLLAWSEENSKSPNHGNRHPTSRPRFRNCPATEANRCQNFVLQRVNFVGIECCCFTAPEILAATICIARSFFRSRRTCCVCISRNDYVSLVDGPLRRPWYLDLS